MKIQPATIYTKNLQQQIMCLPCFCKIEHRVYEMRAEQTIRLSRLCDIVSDMEVEQVVEVDGVIASFNYNNIRSELKRHK